ncbi:MAG: PocR ligand-binding domain-containing protein [Candidatus Methylacidiphilales bacterium]|nr:PocR ligand-binding domain-containing protein [Candidatus Methylacidiphilales bacterium]
MKISSSEIEDSDSSILNSATVFLDYKSAFTRATNLPLNILTADALKIVHISSPQSSFCVLLNEINGGCTACLALQRKLQEESISGPKTYKCFAGLVESVVPIRADGNTIAYLHTGQIFIDNPTQYQFNTLANTLPVNHALIDVERVRRAYFGTQIVPPDRYNASIEMLSAFAIYVAENFSIHIESRKYRIRLMQKAVRFIRTHCSEDLPLKKVAEELNLSNNYFSEIFKKAIGVGFTEYVAKLRIENACKLLKNPNLRIAEVAFGAGFQSLSQFNRIFRKYKGCSPKDYRSSL